MVTDNGVSPLRMADQECVPRFPAFHMRDDQNSSRDDLDTLLNSRMKEINVLGKADHAALITVRAVQAGDERAYAVFEDRAFRKPTTGRRSPISKRLFEAWSVNLRAPN